MAGSDTAVPAAGAAFRGFAGHLVTGVAVVIAMADGQPFATTAGSVVAASWEPPLLAAFFRTGSRMAAALDQCARFTVSILGETDSGLARRFARPGRDPGWAALQGVPVVRQDPAPPILSAAVAWADCRVTQSHVVGDHRCFAGLVRALDRDAQAAPLVFYRGRFRELGAAVAPTDWVPDAGDLAAIW